jgi:hypothetical protein
MVGGGAAASGELWGASRLAHSCSMVTLSAMGCCVQPKLPGQAENRR